MRFEILGPLRCTVGPPDMDLSRRREGRILAAMLLSQHHIVGMDQLVDLLWRDNPPATARQQVQNCMTGLVRLSRAGPRPLALTSTESGYRLEVRRDELDASAFEDDVAAARRLVAAGDRAAAAELLRSAAGRWRGKVLLGLDLGPFAPAAVRLEELRLKAVEQRFDLELGLGRHREVLADLAHAADSAPDRERFVGQYMVALARTGRTAEALGVFQRTRELLRAEYGIEPGADLWAVQRSILGADRSAPAGVRPDRHRRLLDALAAAEVARHQLEIALRDAREVATA
jgi:DNA-binding SARP family transcriptional activator